MLCVSYFIKKILSYLIKREEKNNKGKQAKKAKWDYELFEKKAAKVNFFMKSEIYAWQELTPDVFYALL